MSYTIDEWFSDKAMQILKVAMKKIESDSYDSSIQTEYDIFVQALKEICSTSDFGSVFDRYDYRRKQFSRELFLIGLNKIDEDLIDLIKKSFDLLVDNNDENIKELLSVEYKHNNDKIRCDFSSLEKE